MMMINNSNSINSNQNNVLYYVVYESVYCTFCLHYVNQIPNEETLEQTFYILNLRVS